MMDAPLICPHWRCRCDPAGAWRVTDRRADGHVRELGTFANQSDAAAYAQTLRAAGSRTVALTFAPQSDQGGPDAAA